MEKARSRRRITAWIPPALALLVHRLLCLLLWLAHWHNSQEGTGCVSEESNEFSLRRDICAGIVSIKLLRLCPSTPNLSDSWRQSYSSAGGSSISTEVEVYQLWPPITRTAGEMWSVFSAVRKHGWGHGDFFWLLLYDREMISLYLMEDFFNGFIYLLISSKDNFVFLKEIQSKQPLKPSTLDVVENSSLFISNKKYACIISNKRIQKGISSLIFQRLGFVNVLFKKNKNKNMFLSTSFVASSHQKMSKHLQ